jgi:hypothetical protein
MNPAYRHACFRAELPHGSLPESFAVITACNPEGKTILQADNDERTRQFQAQLAQLGLDHFPVTGFDPKSAHEEPGFGVICDLAAACAMGNAFHQEAIFWIHRGQVALVPLRSGDIPVPTKDHHVTLAPWSAMAESPADHPRFHFRGPFALLDNPATAFLCSTQCPGDKILEAYEWARHQCDTGGTVISGFHTPVEKDVLDILARRGANLIWVPGRDLPMTIDAAFKKPTDENRLLILSPFSYGKPSRPTKESCSLRNRFVLGRTADRFIPYVAEGSSLAADLENHLL